MRRNHLYAYVVLLTNHQKPGIRRFAEKLAKCILRNDDVESKADITLASTADEDELIINQTEPGETTSQNGWFAGIKYRKCFNKFF